MFSALTNTVIMYVDIGLLMILLCLIVCMCTYCVVRIRRLQQTGQMTILLRPTKVLFSHKNQENGKEELRTVVAYQNPFTGDYCVHKPQPLKGITPPSPDYYAQKARPATGYLNPTVDYGHPKYEPATRNVNPTHDYGRYKSQQTIGFENPSIDYGQVTFESGYINPSVDCRKPKSATGYVSLPQPPTSLNAMPTPESTDSGVSDEYEPLKPLDARKEGEYGHFDIQDHGTLQSVGDMNSVNKTWNWNYKEYQI